jgi:hypothetical protein
MCDHDFMASDADWCQSFCHNPDIAGLICCGQRLAGPKESVAAECEDNAHCVHP